MTIARVSRLLSLYSLAGLLSYFLSIFPIYLAYICCKFPLIWKKLVEKKNWGFVATCKHNQGHSILHLVLNVSPTTTRGFPGGNTQSKKPCEYRGRVWSDASISQGMPRIFGNHLNLKKWHGKNSSSEL